MRVRNFMSGHWISSISKEHAASRIVARPTTICAERLIAHPLRHRQKPKTRKSDVQRGITDEELIEHCKTVGEDSAIKADEVGLDYLESTLELISVETIRHIATMLESPFRKLVIYRPTGKPPRSYESSTPPRTASPPANAPGAAQSAP